ncbi:S9 family peptidase [Planomicrobium sp. CPCC 101110]|uniref:alpha/beta hydrolase family protein n=1 Tax=Planomicrobium sp. CPCC 101110 TaxID=2599619 RepID=UPI0011B4DF90|nr:alpha/beta fold hydrolase [Planomicrobium sp. CPCC 101110]TWT27158.1 alpha/beta fold hydrolase [Planomicrobium sp. CPCC 101110]
MEKIKCNQFTYNLLRPENAMQNGFAIILYHGWGTTADSYTELGERIAGRGYTVIIPEILYHDSRNPLPNCFNQEIIQAFFWKTIRESIKEFDDFFQILQISKEQAILVGSSMGGFIANGIFAFQENIGGLVNINGSGSFALTEKLFRKRDGRPDLTTEEETVLKRIDPIQKENALAPVLLMHGDKDTTIPIEIQQNYFQHLMRTNCKAEIRFLIFPDVNHQFTEEMVEELLDWLKEVQTKR